jgi:hypothetical protein
MHLLLKLFIASTVVPALIATCEAALPVDLLLVLTLMLLRAQWSTKPARGHGFFSNMKPRNYLTEFPAGAKHGPAPGDLPKQACKHPMPVSFNLVDLPRYSSRLGIGDAAPISFPWSL